MVIVAQLVRAPDCGSGGRGFETHLSPKGKAVKRMLHGFFCTPNPRCLHRRGLRYKKCQIATAIEALSLRTTCQSVWSASIPLWCWQTRGTEPKSPLMLSSKGFGVQKKPDRDSD